MPAVCTCFCVCHWGPTITARTKHPLLHACCLHVFLRMPLGSHNHCPHKTPTFACLLFARVFAYAIGVPQSLPAQNTHFCMPAVCTCFCVCHWGPTITARTKHTLL